MLQEVWVSPQPGAPVSRLIVTVDLTRARRPCRGHTSQRGVSSLAQPPEGVLALTLCLWSFLPGMPLLSLTPLPAACTCALDRPWATSSVTPLSCLESLSPG